MRDLTAGFDAVGILFPVEAEGFVLFDINNLVWIIERP